MCVFSDVVERFQLCMFVLLIILQQPTASADSDFSREWFVFHFDFDQIVSEPYRSPSLFGLVYFNKPSLLCSFSLILLLFMLFHPSRLVDALWISLVVIVFEAAIDWVKHGFILSFNRIPTSVFAKYDQLLALDLVLPSKSQVILTLSLCVC